MEIPLQNPIEKLSEQKLKKDRKRKQKMFNENREQRLATNNTETISDNPSIKQLAQYVSQLAEALRVFETTTRKELKNIIKMIDLKEDQTNATINKIGNFQKEIESELKDAKTEINLLTTAVEAIKIEKQDQDIQKDKRLELKKIDLANFYIHNKFKYKTGIAMIKENNRLIRVPVIPKYTFDKRTRKWRWRWRYYVQTMNETINFRDFVLEKKRLLIKREKRDKESVQFISSY